MMDSTQKRQDESNESELDRLKRECASMVHVVKSLDDKEKRLKAEVSILAREALMIGFDPSALEAPAPKRRKSIKKEEVDPLVNLS